MEIERKFLIKELPDKLPAYPSKNYTQGYLSTEPVVRVRCEGDSYVLTYKGSGLLCREEYNLPLNKEAFDKLIAKCDGIIIEKTRYRIPLNSSSDSSDSALTAELDVFAGIYKGLVVAEVEFDSEPSAKSFTPPDWFGCEVTFDSRYQNSNLSKGLTDVKELIK